MGGMSLTLYDRWHKPTVWTRCDTHTRQIPVDGVGSDIAYILNLRDNTQAVTRKNTRRKKHTCVAEQTDSWHRDGSFLRMSEKEAERREQMNAEGNRWTENMRGKER